MLLAGAHGTVTPAQLLAIDPGTALITKFQAASVKAWGTWDQPEFPQRLLPQALWLCQSNVSHESPAERLLDRETGCLVALAFEWATWQFPKFSIMDETPRGTESSTRTVYDYAASALGPEGSAFIDAAIAAGLGNPDAPVPTPANLLPFSKIRALKAGSTTIELLTAVRDAWAANLNYRIQMQMALNGIVLADTYDTAAPLLGQGYTKSTQRDPFWPDGVASMPFLCGTGFAGGADDPYQWQACASIVVEMWAGYQATGSKAFYDAAALAYRLGLTEAARSRGVLFGSGRGQSALAEFKLEMSAIK